MIFFLKLTCQKCYTITAEMGTGSVVTGQVEEDDINITFYCEREEKNIPNPDKPVQACVHGQVIILA